MSTAKLRQFVVTGTGRSGTGYAAKLFSTLGIPCGHEQVFNPSTREPDFQELLGDASWLAVPWLRSLPNESVILHQVRHPMEVARSHMGIYFFHDIEVEGHEPYRAFVRQHSRVYEHGNPLERFMRYWVDWNQWIERVANGRREQLTYFRYRLEEMNAETVAHCLDLLGARPNRRAIERVLASIDRQQNRRPRDESLGTHDLPFGPLREQFQQLAARYGYSLDDAPAQAVQPRASPEKLAAQTMVFYKQGDWQNVRLGCQRILNADDAQPKELALAWHLLGTLARRMDDYESAVGCLTRAVELQPDVSQLREELGEVHTTLARRLRKESRLPEAEEQARQAVRLHASDPEAQNVLGVVLHEQGKLPAARKCFEQALPAAPRHPGLRLNYANLLTALLELNAAIDQYRIALELRPNDVNTLLSAGAACLQAERHTQAVALLERAAKLDTGNADVQFNLGNAHVAMGNSAKAVEHYGRALTLRRSWPVAHANWIRQRAEICDWRDDWSDQIESLINELKEELEAGRSSPLNVSQTPALRIPVTLMRRIARHQTEVLRAEQSQTGARSPLHASAAVHQGRLRIGYLSHDFRHHATGHLIRTLFGHHDRQRFEVFTYSYGPDDGSDYRRRIQGDSEHFLDLHGYSDVQMAEQIASDGIGILIDLGGYARNGRPEVLLARPALVLVHYLGFPGTLGGLVDYFVTDPVLTPPGSPLRDEFAEALVYLPDTYQITDDQQLVADRAFTRRDCGLPADAFVFAAFNNNYKIQPEIFDVWMRILCRTPDSVLWLVTTRPEVAENLRSAARHRGVDPSRLVFAEIVSKPEHLARHQLADLFLDTSVCCAHTTATDSLWSDVPLITVLGKRFTERVAASLLSAAGLEELIVADFDTYERLAVELATHPTRLQTIRENWAHRGTKATLFDTAARTRQLEQAYEAIWQRHCAGLPPIDIRS